MVNRAKRSHGGQRSFDSSVLLTISCSEMAQISGRQKCAAECHRTANTPRDVYRGLDPADHKARAADEHGRAEGDAFGGSKRTIADQRLDTGTQHAAAEV